MFAPMTDELVGEANVGGEHVMSVAGEEVWLVMVTTEPADEEAGNPSLTGYFVHATAEGAARGLRETLAEVGSGVLTPELFAFETDETGYHGSVTLDDQVISCSVAPLIVNA